MIEPQQIDLLAFAEILIDKLSDAQISEIIGAIMDRYENDCCPICGSERLPFSKEGKRIGYMSELPQDAEWHDMHEVSCMVTLLEELREAKKGEEEHG